jgi:hypothetical protein
MMLLYTALFLALIAQMVCGEFLRGGKGRFLTPKQSSVFPTDIAVSHIIEFYALESAAPSNLKDASDYSANILLGGLSGTHSGVGVYNTNTGAKFSIELLQSNGDYGRLFFPDLTQLTKSCNNSAEVWGNHGEIVVTNPIDPTLWTTSTRFATGNGQAYTQIIKWIQGLSQDTLLLQPINVVYDAEQTAGRPGSMTGSPSLVTEFGPVVVKASDSYAFTKRIIDYSAYIGCNMGTFAPFIRNTISYVATSGIPDNGLKVISLIDNAANEPARTYAITWFTCMQDCSKNVIPTSAGIVNFAQQVRVCYVNCGFGKTYLYRDATSVWQAPEDSITLANGVSLGAPLLLRVADYTLPQAEVRDPLQFDTLDLVLYGTSLGIALLYVVAGLYYRLVRKKERRRLSIAAEGVAEAGAEAFGKDEAISETSATIARYFYEERRDRAWTLGMWWRYFRGEKDIEKQKLDKNARTTRTRAVSNVLQSRSGRETLEDDDAHSSQAASTGEVASPVHKSCE